MCWDHFHLNESGDTRINSLWSQRLDGGIRDPKSFNLGISFRKIDNFWIVTTILKTLRDCLYVCLRSIYVYWSSDEGKMRVFFLFFDWNRDPWSVPWRRSLCHWMALLAAASHRHSRVEAPSDQGLMLDFHSHPPNATEKVSHERNKSAKFRI